MIPHSIANREIATFGYSEIKVRYSIGSPLTHRYIERYGKDSSFLEHSISTIRTPVRAAG